MEQKKNSYIPEILGGVGTTGLAYLLLRKPFSAKEKITRLIHKKEPKNILEKTIDKVLYGADDVFYTKHKKIPKKPIKKDTIVVFDSPIGTKFLKSKKEIGSVREDIIKKINDNKRVEAEILKRIDKRSIPKFWNPKKSKNILQKLQKNFKNKGYYIKPKDSYSTGLFGVGFLSEKEIKDFLNNKKISKTLLKKIKDFKKNPQKYIVQQKVNIEKSLFGVPKEYRIHAVGNKVVPGASFNRSYDLDITSQIDKHKAEKFIQKVVSKLPKKYKNMTFGFDVVKTKNGFKIIETNAGPLGSGFMDPLHLAEHFKDEPFLYRNAPVFGSMWANQNLYKQLTGRETPFKAMLKSILAAPIGAASAHYLKKEN